MSGPLDWETDGRDWPLRDCSRFVTAAGLRWHVQVSGQGPVVLLLHGTGAATHSWRGLAPLLARDFTVVAPDLPGHGFTTGRPARGLSLPGMSSALHALLRELGLAPAMVAGHSAGAAIAARMILDGHLPEVAFVSLNGALATPPGLPALLFSPVAKLLAASSLVPRVFAWSVGDRAAVERLVMGTGSTLDAAGIELYGRLVRNTTHVAGVLEMMSQWELAPLERDLARLRSPTLLVVASNDRAVPPSEGQRLAGLIPGARLLTLPGLGHLAHEEQPARIAELVREMLPRTAAA